MKRIQAFVACLLLLCGALTVNAQKRSTDSQFMKEFGPAIAKEARAEKKREQKAASRKNAPGHPTPDFSVEMLNRTLATQIVLPAPAQFNLPPVSLEKLLGSGPSKSARGNKKTPVVATAAVLPQSVVRKVDKDRLIVRPNPRSWYLGSINKKDSFRVKAVGGNKDRWAFGDVIGNPKLKNVWVLREGLKPGPVPVREPPKLRNSDQSRDNLANNYASWISPKGRDDGVETKLLNGTRLFGNYNPNTRKFYDPINRLDPSNQKHEYRVRWITDNGQAAIIRHYRVNQSGREIKGTSQWGIAPCSALGGPCR